MKNILQIITFSCYVASPQSIDASAEGSITTTFVSAELLIGKSGYKIEFQLTDDNELSELVTTWKGNKTPIVEGELKGLKSVYLRGVETVAPNDVSGGEQLEIIVILPYHVHTLQSGDEYWRVSDIIRLHFFEGKLESWEKAEGDPNTPERWILSKWEKEGKIETDGTVTRKTNPYIRGFPEDVK